MTDWSKVVIEQVVFADSDVTISWLDPAEIRQHAMVAHQIRVQLSEAVSDEILELLSAARTLLAAGLDEFDASPPITLSDAATADGDPDDDEDERDPGGGP